MRLQQYVIGMMFLILFLAGCTGTAQTPTGDVVSELNDDPEKVTIYFFWGDGCAHCAEEKPFLEDLDEKYPKVEVKMFETWNDPDNAALFQEVAKAYGIRAGGVPTTFIGEEHWVGYAEYMDSDIEAKVLECIEDGCINPGDKLKQGE